MKIKQFLSHPDSCYPTTRGYTTTIDLTQPPIAPVKDTLYVITSQDVTCREDVIMLLKLFSDVWRNPRNGLSNIVLTKVHLIPNSTDSYNIRTSEEMKNLLDNIKGLMSHYYIQSNVVDTNTIEILINSTAGVSHSIMIFASYLNLMMRDFSKIKLITNRRLGRDRVSEIIINNLHNFNGTNESKSYNHWINNKPFDMLLAYMAIRYAKQSTVFNGPVSFASPPSLSNESYTFNKYKEAISKYISTTVTATNYKFWIARYSSLVKESSPIYKIIDESGKFFNGKRTGSYNDRFCGNGREYTTHLGASVSMARIVTKFKDAKLSLVTLIIMEA